jgi:hypothetical protein
VPDNKEVNLAHLLFFYLFLPKNGLFGKTSLFIQVFFVPLHAKSIDWNIKLAEIPNWLEYQID